MKQLHWMIRMLVYVWVISHSSTYANDVKQRYNACIACHGEQGQGNIALYAPALAQQFDWYLERQLQHFANDIRGSSVNDTHGKTMVPFAKTITDKKQRQELAVYISQLKPLPENTTDKTSLSGDLKNGSRYYHGKCGACHGGKAQGNPSFNAPKLTGIDPQYLLRQMRHFQQGVRGQHQDDKWGRQMAMMSKSVSDNELNDILYFISEQVE
ncbi:MAG: c-type cytochrome [Paraglaciecola sp.]|uniref:c-type cytochrome n=1 Tax=Paraglaciecola sp. TaxID=1920173 RepID=UPI003299B5BC